MPFCANMVCADALASSSVLCHGMDCCMISWRARSGPALVTEGHTAVSVPTPLAEEMMLGNVIQCGLQVRKKLMR